MTLNTIKEKLHFYVESGDPKKVKAFYNLVADEISTHEMWNKEFVTELDKRTYEMENGLVKTYTLDEMIKQARKKSKTKPRNGVKNTSQSKYWFY